MPFLPRFDDTTCFLDIRGTTGDTKEYYVEFIDQTTNKVEYENTITVNHWCKFSANEKKDWLIRVSVDNQVVWERKQGQKYNKVHIILSSSSLGDTIAWVPYADEYRKKHNVKVVCSCYHKELFAKRYPEIEFIDFTIENADKIIDVEKTFKINQWPLHLGDKDQFDNIHTVDYRNLPLQFVAPLILGLPLEEVTPKVVIPDGGPNIKVKYVVVAIQSTSQLKYWNHPFGWERVFDFLSKQGYKIVLIDKHKSFGIYGNYNQAPKNSAIIDKTGNRPLSDRIIDIKYADFVITISSGLAWLSWAVGKPVVLISGFTKPWYEFQENCYRVHNPNVCNGCWNDDKIKFEPTDWLFCPRKSKDAVDVHICSKAIQPKDVIDSIKEVIEDIR